MMAMAKQMISFAKNIGWVAVVLAAIAWATPSSAQTPATYHVFPFVADGDTGITNRTVFVVTRHDGAATCDLTLYGIDSSRLVVSPNFSIGGAGQPDVWVGLTIGTGPAQRGYASLSCNSQVTAYAAYLHAVPVGLPSVAMAFSAVPGNLLEFTGFQASALGVRLAFGVANDSGTSESYEIQTTTAGGSTLSVTRTLPAKTSERVFLDEVMTFNAQTLETLVVKFAADAPIHVTGLQLVGDDVATMTAVQANPDADAGDTSDPLGLEGSWVFTFTANSVSGSACAGEEGEVGDEFLEIFYDPQTGNYSMDGDGFNLQGTTSVSGNTLSYSGTFPEDGGITNRESLVMELVSPGVLSGIEMWTWSDDGIVMCTNGNSSVEGVKLD